MRESDFEIHSQIFQFKKVQNFVIINYFKKCRQYIGMIQQRKTSSSKFETDKTIEQTKFCQINREILCKLAFNFVCLGAKAGLHIGR